MSAKQTTPSDLQRDCERLRSLHVPGNPLVLPNAWDVATARAVVEAGFPVVATTSGGVAAALGYEDHEGAPAKEMFAAAARICSRVEVPVTVDAEAGYGMEPEELVTALREVGAAGCNLEDTNHPAETLRDPDHQAEWLRGVRAAASDQGYGLVINARIDVFLANSRGRGARRPRPRSAPAGACLPRRRRRLRLPDRPLGGRSRCPFISEAGGPVNILAIPNAPSVSELAELGAARISYGGLLHWQAMEQFRDSLASLAPGSEPAQA